MAALGAKASSEADGEIRRTAQLSSLVERC